MCIRDRPCVVVTPSDLNMYLTTVVIAPITSTIRNYPYRVLCSVAVSYTHLDVFKRQLLDHVIVAGNNYYSYADEGKL